MDWNIYIRKIHTLHLKKHLLIKICKPETFVPSIKLLMLSNISMHASQQLSMFCYLNNVSFSQPFLREGTHKLLVLYIPLNLQ
jgi:hypothetical protein